MEHLILEMPRRLDGGTQSKTKKQVSKAFTGIEPMVIMDFENCEFIDSLGLSVIVTALKLAGQKKKSLRLVHVGDEIKLLLQITRFDRICDIRDSMESALRN